MTDMRKSLIESQHSDPIGMEIVEILEKFLQGVSFHYTPEEINHTWRFLTAIFYKPFEEFIFGETITEDWETPRGSDYNHGKELLLSKIIELGIDPNKVIVIRLTKKRDAHSKEPENYWSLHPFHLRAIAGKERKGLDDDIIVSTLADLYETAGKVVTAKDDFEPPSLKRVGNYPFSQKHIRATCPSPWH